MAQSQLEISFRGLMSAIDRLEQAAHYLETHPKGKTRDLFSEKPSPASLKKSGKAPNDPAVARRIDTAIQRVEELLGEGR